MVKAKECCCGCTLRTGTLILLWTLLIIVSLETMTYLRMVIYPNTHYYSRFKLSTWDTIRNFYFLIVSVTGLAICVSGIYGVQKNLPRYLTPSYYYFFYYICYWCLTLVVLIIYPSLYVKIAMLGPIFLASSHSLDLLLVVVMWYIFVIALSAYFTLIIRSYRDLMRRTCQNVEVADPVAIGYSSSA